MTEPQRAMMEELVWAHRDAETLAGDLGLDDDSTSMLQSLGFWPRPVTSPATRPGSPYVCQIGDVRSLHFDWSSIQSGMSLNDPLELQFDYTRMMMGFLVFNPAPRSIEMIGLGGGSLAKYCYHKVPGANITVAEIDGDVIALRDAFLIPPDGPRFRVLCDDGAHFISRQVGCPDVLLIDGFDRDGQPPQLCSQDFYRTCYDRMAPSGLLIANLWGDHEVYSDRIRRAFFGNVIVIETEGGGNRAAIARKDGNLDLSPSQLEATLATLAPCHDGFLPAIGRRILTQVDRERQAYRNARAGRLPSMSSSDQYVSRR
ncbi:putative transferase, Spermidine synthase [Sphingobium indicum BiD32]|uniref:Transferase, Spermidine synthase n=1 Tax=Sphingobium indicum BiD32 TaxID=1301087 RepID=N1MPR8_9SPHN|nr:hypothetical protein [Sphingobium indicum]CCW18941.1 putative transferase, Spermidine synthase [Sphingobium indicum BiD32]